MDITYRLKECEQKFNKKNEERNKYITLAEECMTELTKLQGEYRILKELLDDLPKAAESKKEDK